MAVGNFSSSHHSLNFLCEILMRNARVFLLITHSAHLALTGRSCSSLSPLSTHIWCSGNDRWVGTTCLHAQTWRPLCHRKYLQLPPDSQGPMRLTVLTSRPPVSQLHWMEYHDRMKAQALGTPCFLHQKDQCVDGDEKLFFFLLGVRGKEVRSNCHRNANWTKEGSDCQQTLQNTTPKRTFWRGRSLWESISSDLIWGENFWLFHEYPSFWHVCYPWQCEVLS